MASLEPPHFDYAQAAVAEAALRSAAADVDALVAQRLGLADNAREGWAGPTRVDFDTQLDAQRRRAAEVSSDLRSQASRLALLAGQARDAQRAWDAYLATNSLQPAVDPTTRTSL